MSIPEHVKINFSLVQDSDGYPLVAVESVWAIKAPSGLFVIDNIPFFARDATLGDVVSVREEDGHLWFSEVQVSSGNSLVRVALFDKSRFDELSRQLEHFGCSSEGFRDGKLVAVNIPKTAALDAIQEYLRSGSVQGWLDFEEPILRQ